VTQGKVSLKVVDDLFQVIHTPEELYDIVRNELGDLEQIAEELRQAAARMSSASG